MNEAGAPFYFQPSRQSPIAILLILARLIRSLLSQFWPLLLLLFFRKPFSGGNQFWVWVGIGITVISVVRSLLTYFRTYFYIAQNEFILEKGGFNRRRLSVPLDKIQTITFQQTFLHRLFDVVSVEVDTTGAKGAEISINALEHSKAILLREYLLRWKKENLNEVESPEEGVAEVQDEVLFKLDIGDLLRIGISQNHLRSAGILFGLLASFAREIQPILGKSAYKYLEEELGLNVSFFWSFALWIALFFLVIAVFSTLIITLIRHYNLQFIRTGAGFRLQAGLFTLREQIAYLPKMQYLYWSANPLQRMWGMFALKFYQAAGYDLQDKQTIQVPGMYTAQIAEVQEAYFKDFKASEWAWEKPHVLYYLQALFVIGVLPFLGLMLKTYFDFTRFWLIITLLWLPITAWWQWQAFQRRRYGFNQEGLWVKTGFFTQSQTLLLWTNIQSIVLQQSLLEKRYGVAGLSFYTASGSVEIDGLPLPMVNALRDFVLAKIEAPERTSD